MMTPPIPEAERDRRRESWRQANASVRLAGGRLPADFLTLQELHIHGLITRAGIRAALDRMDRDTAFWQGAGDRSRPPF